jgi:hypothetical protein
MYFFIFLKISRRELVLMLTLAIKFIVSIIAFAVALDLFFEATFVDILSFSLAITIVSYIIGDRIILPRVGNTNALLLDFFLTYLMVWIFGSVVLESYVQIGWGSLLSAIIITAAEVVVHRFLQKNHEVEVRKQTSLSPKLAFGMEMAEEENPRLKK